MSTGSVTVNAAGGSGSYNYRAIGPISTPFTSTSTITGLQPGTYDVIVKDVTTGCTKTESVEISGTYSDPRFQLSKTDVSCAGNDGTITSGSLQFGRAPFSYKIIAPSPSNVGATNSTGNFSNLTPGEYAIQLQDSCGGIQVRRITIESYSWWFDNITAAKIDCDDAQATVTLKDNKGNLNTSGTSFTGFKYGYVVSPGDTQWHTSNTFQFNIGTKHNATIVAKDACGNIYAQVWTIPSNQRPTVGTVSISNRTCNTFTATMTGQQNLQGTIEYSLYKDGVFVEMNNSGIFNNKQYGNYCIRVKDQCYDTTIERCYSAARLLPSVASGVTISNRTCSTFTASITGQTNLTNVDYCLYTSANVQVACNANGIFNNVPYGSYEVRIHDVGCVDTTFTRSFNEVEPVPTLNNLTVTGNGCSGFDIRTNGGNNLFNTPTYCLYDNNGNRITCNTTGVFTGLTHGTYCVRGVTSCLDTTAPVCITGVPPTPSVAASVQVYNKNCTTFSARITGQTNLTNPSYCLYNASTNALVQPCNSTGEFDNIPYGSYYITTTDGCNGTVITRNFSATQVIPSINGTFSVTNKTCNTFTATVSGSNLLTPRYYLLDQNGNPVADNTSGVFNNLPYGRYCAEIEDACGTRTQRICETVSINTTISVTTTKICKYDTTNLQITFASPNSPYTINIYHPSGALVYNTTTSSATTTIATLPMLPAGEQYKVVGSDQCGNADEEMITPQASHISKNITVVSKCPSSAWQNGSGDLSVNCSSNLYTVSPSIVKKNGSNFSKNYSSNSGTNFVFSDLEPATYIVQYTMQNCSGKLYDTVQITPYAFPNQSRSAVYQCVDNSFSLGAAVTGGVGPFEYEIIGSMPNDPSIITPRQSAPVFNINTGVTYSLIRLRSIDACGNAALNDISVLPLQNIAASANSTCLYNDITLTVDTIPNASYTWYKKTSPTDSVLLVNNISYNDPFLEPEEVGTYVCRVSVNNDCLVRLAYFDLTGDCGHVVLVNKLKLAGKTIDAGHVINWSSTSGDIVEFIIERQIQGSTQFVPVGRVKAQPNGGAYSFTDRPESGTTLYRIKAIGKQTTVFSNQVSLVWIDNKIQVYPNPVKNELTVSIKQKEVAEYELQLLNNTGQLIDRKLIKGNVYMYSYRRKSSDKPGMYLMKVINKKDLSVTIYKMLFE